MKTSLAALTMILLFSSLGFSDAGQCDSSIDCPGVSMCNIATGQCVYPDGNSGYACDSSAECPGTMICNIAQSICENP